jgi:hypothetical protein
VFEKWRNQWLAQESEPDHVLFRSSADSCAALGAAKKIDLIRAEKSGEGRLAQCGDDVVGLPRTTG